MSNTVLIVLIIAVVVLIVLVIFRKQLSEFVFKANRDGLETSLKTHAGQQQEGAGKTGKPTGTQISKNVQRGGRNRIEVDQPGTEVRENLQDGEGNVITTRPPAEKKPRKK